MTTACYVALSIWHGHTGQPQPQLLYDTAHTVAYCMTPHMPTVSLMRCSLPRTEYTQWYTFTFQPVSPGCIQVTTSSAPMHPGLYQGKTQRCCTIIYTASYFDSSTSYLTGSGTSYCEQETAPSRQFLQDSSFKTVPSRQLLQDSFFKTAPSRQYSLVWTKGVCMTSEASDAGPSDAGPSDADP